MKDDRTDEIYLHFIIFIGVILLIGCLFEVTILGIAFFGADKVECNFLWCEFTTERTYINDTIIRVQNQECYLGNERINCSDFPKIPIIDVDGNWN